MLAIRSSSAAAALRGDGQRAVLDEAAGVDQVGDVLPGGAAASLVALGHSGLPTLVEGDQVALPDLVEVGPRPVEIHCRRGRFAVAVGAGPGEDQQWIAGADDLAGRHQDADRPQRIRRDQRVLHLHRLEHHQLRAGAEIGAVGRRLDDGAGQLRAQHFLARVELHRRDQGVVLVGQRRGREFGELGVEEIRRNPARTESDCPPTALEESEMLVRTPSMPNSPRAVRALRSAVGNDEPRTWAMTLASSESYRGLGASPGRP